MALLICLCIWSNAKGLLIKESLNNAFSAWSDRSSGEPCDVAHEPLVFICHYITGCLIFRSKHFRTPLYFNERNGTKSFFTFVNGMAELGV